MDLLRDLWDDWPGRLLLALMVGLLLMIPAIIYSAIAEEKNWQAFSVAHRCKKVAHAKGDVSTGVGYGMTASGQFGPVIVTTTTSDKTAWLCDDGVTYWR